MGVALRLLLVLGLSQLVNGQNSESRPMCPPTSVDCACVGEDGNDYIIQMDVTTISLTDDDTGLDRCIAEGDPISLCQEHNCIIIPNDNFEILFQKGKKISPSNYLQEEDDIDRPPSRHASKKKGYMADEVMLHKLMSQFYPVELKYPRMIQNINSSRLVKRSMKSKNRNFKMRDDDEDELLTKLEAEVAAMTSQDQRQRLQQTAVGSYGGGYYNFACRVPQLKNSEVTCWKWPNWQSCKQTCIYGHGIGTQRGTMRSMTFSCRNSENTWKPHRIADCQ
ncbi:uncharacterized protein TNCT_730611, partial [Trichonephila clavata]